jgi:periplasmic divalent cation tolerance protein
LTRRVRLAGKLAQVTVNDNPPQEGHGVPHRATPEGDNAAADAKPEFGLVVVYATFPSRDAALACATLLVEAKLAGCVNVIPGMTAVYIWEGRTETADEAVLIAKVARENADAAVDLIVQSHAYDIPAVLVLPVTGGNPAYINWLRHGTTLA